MAFARILDINSTLNRKSTFLFGARSTGKTTLYRETVKPTRSYDLLSAKTLKRLRQNPELIYEECKSAGEIIVVDEVQKIPELLDEIHRTIEEKKARFLLTGSSARKLKRSQPNLLGGRASQLELLPLTTHEIPDFDLFRYLNHGGIPRHYLTHAEHILNELEDYTSLYLKQEILDEALTRSVDNFTRFLEIMALHTGDELVIENFASDAGIKASTFKNYLEILIDTLVGFEVTPFLSSTKRKAITRSKFFLFDVGVAGFLSDRGIIGPKNPLAGKAFEHFIAMELRAFLTYNRIRKPLEYWRTTSQFEVDFVLGRKLAVEVKVTDHVHERMLKGLRALREEQLVERYVVVSLDPTPRVVDGIEILPWKYFLTKLWGREWF
ncbi:AAA family ATPase [Bdellovibrionota bacterium FG-2]